MAVQPVLAQTPVAVKVYAWRLQHLARRRCAASAGAVMA